MSQAFEWALLQVGLLDEWQALVAQHGAAAPAVALALAACLGFVLLMLLAIFDEGSGL